MNNTLDTVIIIAVIAGIAFAGYKVYSSGQAAALAAQTAAQNSANNSNTNQSYVSDALGALALL